MSDPGYRSWPRHTLALAAAEWRRLLTTPVWAVLLVVWTISTALVFRVALDQAASEALPAGTTPMAFLFMFFPQMMALLLVVFVPPLTMDAIAGRRERGRLEQMLVAGLQPSALMAGAFIACAGLVALLLTPLVIFHLVLGPYDPDPGHTVGGSLAVYAEALAMSALGLAASAWCRNRLLAVLVATAIGMLWWIADFWGSVEGDGPGLSLLNLLPGLAETVYSFAEGQASWSLLLRWPVVILLLLQLGRIGVRWRGRPLVAGVTTVASVLAGGLVLHILSRAPGAVDLTWRGEHQVAEVTSTTVNELVGKGDVEAVLVASPAMRNHDIDGPLVNGCRRLLQALSSSGLRVTYVDPAASPAATAQLARELDLVASDLARPFLILRHGGRDEVLRADSLGVVEDRNGRQRLVALTAESAILNAARRLRDGALPRIAWLEGPGLRAVDPVAANQRGLGLGSWRRHLAADGFDLIDLDDWTRLNELQPACAILAGPQTDPNAAGLAAIADYLGAGGSLLVALDGRRPATLAALERSLRPHGIGWTPGVILTTQAWRENNADLLQVVELTSTATTGPAALLARDGRTTAVPLPVPLDVRPPEGGYQRLDQLPTPIGTWLRTLDGRTSPDRAGRPLVSASVGPNGQRVVVLAAVDMLSDHFIGVAGNRTLAAGTMAWLVRPGEADQLPPRDMSTGILRLGGTRLAVLHWGIGWGLPALAIIAGWSVWWWRRRA